MTSILKVTEIQDPTNGNTALTIDTTGRILTPARPAFFAYKNGGNWQSFGGTDITLMPFNETSVNIGNCYDTTNYKFVVPVDGVYSFYFQFYADGTTNDARIGVDGSYVVFSRNRETGTTVSANYIASLTANQEVTAYGRVNISDTNDWFARNDYSFFSGFLVG